MILAYSLSVTGKASIVLGNMDILVLFPSSRETAGSQLCHIAKIIENIAVLDLLP